MSLLEPDVPEDFDAFWAEAVAEAAQQRLDFVRDVQDDVTRPGFTIETLSFRGMGGHARHGWIAYPDGARRLPSFLWIPPYSRWSMMPNQYGTREGMTSFSFNLHGESAFHQEDYTPKRGYFAEGALEPRTWVFRRMVQDCLIALRVLEAQPEVDETRMASMGMSQGGGMSVWLGALSPKIKAVVADMPFLGAMPWVFQKMVHRYPLKELTDFMEANPLGRERVLHTLSYFDTMHFATRCAVPTLLTAGLKDPAVRPDQVRAIFQALAGEKELVELDWGHDWHPSMVDRNLIWLKRFLG